MEVFHSPKSKEFSLWASPFIKSLGEHHPPGPHPHDPSITLAPFPERAEILLNLVTALRPDLQITRITWPPSSWEITCPNCYTTFTATPIQPFLCRVCMAGIKLECEEKSRKFDEEKILRWAELKAIREKAEIRSHEKRREEITAHVLGLSGLSESKPELSESKPEPEPGPRRLTFGIDLPPPPSRKTRKSSK